MLLPFNCEIMNKRLASCIPQSLLKSIFSRVIEKTFLESIFNVQIKIRGEKIAKVAPVLLIVIWTSIIPFYPPSQKQGKTLTFDPRIMLLKLNIR